MNIENPKFLIIIFFILTISSRCECKFRIIRFQTRENFYENLSISGKSSLNLAINLKSTWSYVRGQIPKLSISIGMYFGALRSPWKNLENSEFWYMARELNSTDLFVGNKILLNRGFEFNLKNYTKGFFLHYFQYSQNLFINMANNLQEYIFILE